MNKVHFALLLELSQKISREEAAQAATSESGEGVQGVVKYIGRGDAIKPQRLNKAEENLSVIKIPLVKQTWSEA